MKTISDKNVIQARLKWAHRTVEMYDEEEITAIIDQLHGSSDEIWAFDGAREWMRGLGKSDNEIERLFTALRLLNDYEELPVVN
jgi:hypothetical protein